MHSSHSFLESSDLNISRAELMKHRKFSREGRVGITEQFFFSVFLSW